MRMLVEWDMPLEPFNSMVKDGTAGAAIEKALGAIKPEAAYFTTEDGKRTALIVFDMDDVTQLPSVAEPFFQIANASVDIKPVMTAEDLQKGIERAGG